MADPTQRNIPAFDAKQLESIAKILGDTESGLTGHEIGLVFSQCAIDDPDPKMTKWKRICEAFNSSQREHRSGRQVVEFIEEVMTKSVWDQAGPTERIRRELNAVLSSCGMQIGEDGKVGRAASPSRRLITELSIENFKGIRDRVALEIRPITLLFGANSAGKSTFLHAIHYAREIFERRNLDADETISGGKYINLGGFEQFVHNHDLDRRVKLSFQLDLHDEVVPSFEHLVPVDAAIEPSEPLSYDIATAEIAVEVAWSRSQHAPYVSEFSVKINGSWLATLTHEPGRREVRLRFDVQHPVLLPASANDWLNSLSDDGFEIPDSGMPTGIERLWQLAREREVLPELDKSGIPIDVRGDALPDLDQRLSLGADYSGSAFGQQRDEDQGIVESIEQTLSHLILGPSQLLRQFLKSTRYIGPLRETPDRNYSPPRYADPSRWSSGLGAWDALQNGSDKFVQIVGDWLGDADKLNSGYRIERRRFKEIDLADPLMMKLVTGRAFDEADEDERIDIDATPTLSRLVIVPQDSKLELRPHDVGVGISQVVPVVVTALADERKLLAIEQPELHLHPKIQAELGDLFIEAALGDRQHLVILETHSELIPLRLMRRIRETSELTLPPGKSPLTSKDVGIYYIETHDSATITTHLELSQQGQLLDPWPEGFFEEGFHERFKE